MTRTFKIEPGHRDERMPLFIGLVGPSGSGKTRSALRLAVGMQQVAGGSIVFINTEGRRGTMDLDLFRKPDGTPLIQHMAFDAPYGSEDYLDAILQAKAAGARTIVIDSLSHEHEQEGGLLDFHERELERLAGDDWKKREAVKMLAWGKPKAARRKLLTRGIMQADTNLIACFRAKETSRPVKKDGKTVVEAMGFTPIAGDEFVFECALSAFLPPNSQGVPDWHPDHPGERMAVKRPDHLADIVRDGEQLTEEVGARLARWASGGVKPFTQVQDESALAVYIAKVQATVNSATDPAQLGAWWNSAGEKQSRAALGLQQSDVDNLKKLVIDRINELNGGEKAA